MADFPVIPAGYGLPLVNTTTGEPPQILEDWLSNAFGAGTSFPPDATASDLFAAYLDFGSIGHLRWACAGDSLFNDITDMPGRVMLALTQATPTGAGGREYTTSGGGSPTYGSPHSWKASSGSPDVGGTVMQDNFNRVETDLVGDTSSGGQVWTGTAGAWSSNGTVASSAGTASQSLDFDAGDKVQTITETLSIITTAPGTARQWRIYGVAVASGSSVAGTNTHCFIDVGITTGGNLTFSLYKRVAGSATQLGSTSTNPPGTTANSATPVTVEVELDVNGTTVTATIRISGQSDVVISGSISGGDLTAMGTRTGTGANNTGSAITMTSIDILTPFTPGDYRGITLYNGAVAGSTLAYQETHVAALYPSGTPLDVLLVGNGHNATAMSDADFIQMFDDFIDAFIALHPETRIVVVSQNPQKAGTLTDSDTIAAQARLQLLVRNWTLGRGFEYIPAFEAFTNQTDGGASLINADGIHPTLPASWTTLDWCGYLLMASVWLRQIASRRRVALIPPITTNPDIG